MTREQHNAISNSDRRCNRTPPSAPSLPRPEALTPLGEQAAVFQTAGMLAASLAHDLSNPLCGVRSVLERMSRKPTQDDAERDLLRLALQQCDQMRLLLAELQDFVAPASGKLAAFALDRTLESVLLLVRKHLRICGCGVEFSRPATPLVLHGEESRIRLVLAHLLLHCCHAPVDEDSLLHIQAGVEGGRIQLILNWQHVPRQRAICRPPLPAVETTPWFAAILRQHGGELHQQPQNDGSTRLILSFPLHHAEVQ